MGNITFAHFPILAKDNHPYQQSAVELEDIEISSVIYQQLTKEAPSSWITFQGEKGKLLSLELGIPVINGLEGFRPSLALIAPKPTSGLLNSSGDLPNPLEVFPSSDIVEPLTFHEPFTNTDSWILFKKAIRLSETGWYYLRTFSPENETGKLWLAIGKKESFGIREISKLPLLIRDVKDFHEINRGHSSQTPPWASRKLLLFPLLLIGFLLLLKFRRSRQITNSSKEKF